MLLEKPRFISCKNETILVINCLSLIKKLKLIVVCPLLLVVFTKEGKFGYVNPTKIDIYSTEKLPNKNIGEYTVAPNNEITFRFTETVQGFLPIKMRIENSGKTVIVERDKEYGDVIRKTAVYQLQE
jgi:hypothetical protein